MIARWSDVVDVVERVEKDKTLLHTDEGKIQMFLEMNKATYGQGEITMGNLIRERAGSDVTDPRDYFYCLLGIAKDRGEWAGTIRADYNVSTPSL